MTVFPYWNAGLEILAFPCNQFGSQEPGTNEQIQEFACTQFKAEYPVFSKVNFLFVFVFLVGASVRTRVQRI